MLWKAKITPKYKKNDASALFSREWIKTSDSIRMRWKMSGRPPQPEKAGAGYEKQYEYRKAPGINRSPELLYYF